MIKLRLFRERIQNILDYYRLRRSLGPTSFLKNVKDLAQTFISPTTVVLFYPQRPTKQSVEYKLCALLGYAVTRYPNRPVDVVFKRYDTTVFDPAILSELNIPQSAIVNSESIDISKKHVNDVFEKVFGYPLRVDPLRYQGRIVQKSNSNAAHDGKILQGPLTEADLVPGTTYQKAIDNTKIRPGYAEVFRVPIHGQTIPVTYHKFRKIETQFTSNGENASLVDPASVFSSQEQRLLLSMASSMGTDYCEVDVLRDTDGRIYVIDVNNTPWGPSTLNDEDRMKALSIMTHSFAALLRTKRFRSREMVAMCLRNGAASSTIRRRCWWLMQWFGRRTRRMRPGF